MKRYIHVYTGNGKGKTTASLGLALRAYGAGFKVFIGQFVKGRECSEHKTLALLKDQITVRQYGKLDFIINHPSKGDIELAQQGFREIKEALLSKSYDLVILDEINIALYYKLIDLNDLIALINEKPAEVELVITGRNVPEEIIDKADLVTEMKEIKHYYSQGVQARKGIEN
ncbi:cob(I)yrinic acid a,c-diamide adenosyltransferase [Candidatus Auribacterota bacterium]